MTFHADIYHRGYFFEKGGPEQASFDAGQLRWGDQVCAIGYAFGIDSYEEVQTLFGWKDDHVPEPRVPLLHQMLYLWAARWRTPRGVLEVGAGRGEVSIALAQRVPTIALEPAMMNFGSSDTACMLGLPNTVALPIVWTTDFAMLRREDFQPSYMDIDTVLFIESYEHLAGDITEAWNNVVAALKRTHGRLIIVNWVDYHPMQIAQSASAREHCRIVDDALYDSFAAEAARTVFRRGSHLVLEY